MEPHLGDKTFKVRLFGHGQLFDDLLLLQIAVLRHKLLKELLVGCHDAGWAPVEPLGGWLRLDQINASLVEVNLHLAIEPKHGARRRAKQSSDKDLRNVLVAEHLELRDVEVFPDVHAEVKLCSLR